MSGKFWESLCENDASVIFVLDRSFRVQYCNAAWDRFARENGGGPAVFRDSQIGRSIFDVTPPVLKNFYLERYEYVLREGSAEHFYECSGPDTARQFQMHLQRIETAGNPSPFILVVNSLYTSEPINDEESAFDAGTLAGENGLITMCAHCRRVRVPGSDNLWIWVPALVRSMPRSVSHGLCRPCFAIHYEMALRTGGKERVTF